LNKEKDLIRYIEEKSSRGFGSAQHGKGGADAFPVLKVVEGTAYLK